MRNYLPLFLLLISFSIPINSGENLSQEFLSELTNAKPEDVSSLLEGKFKNISILEIRTALLEQISKLKIRNDYQTAMKISRLLLRVSEIRNDKESTILAIHAIGTIQEAEGKKEEALQSFTESLNLSESIGYSKGIAASLERIGNLKKDWAQYEAALQDLNRSLQIFRTINDTRGTADALSTIGDVYLDQVIFDEALDFHKQSLKLRDELGDRMEQGKSYVRIGNVYGGMARTDLALKNWEIAAQMFETSGSKAGLAGVYNNMANAVTGYGNWGLGLQYYLKSLKGCEEVRSKQCMAFPTLNIGVLHEAHGNYELALDYYKKANDLFEETGMKAIAIIAQSNIAGIYALLGRYKDALDLYTKVLNTQKERGNETGGVYGAMAGVYELKGEYKTALLFCQKSLERHKLLGENYWVLDKTLMMSRLNRRLKKFYEALDFAKTAIGLANEIGDREMHWAALLEEGRAYKTLGNIEKAKKDFEEAIRLLEFLRTQAAGSEVENQQYFQSRTDPYYEMILCLVSENKAVNALNYAELYKSRVLLDVLGNGKISVTKDMTAEEKEQEQSLKSDLISLNSQILNAKASSSSNPKNVEDLQRQLQKARLNLESFRTNLYATHPRLNLHRGELTPASFDKTAGILHKNQILLEYVVADQQSILFVVTNSKNGQPTVRMHTIQVTKDHLSGRVQKFRRQLADQDPEFRALSSELYRLLIKPAESEISGDKDSVIIVPDRDLWELPFQALQNHENKYLLQKAAVSYAPSLTVLHEMSNAQKNRSSSRTLLALANPQIADETTDRLKALRRQETLYPLREAEKGVKSLATVYGSANAKILTGMDAREHTFKKEAKEFDVIHLAAHGIFSNTDPMYSHIVLAKQMRTQTEDGLLEPWEVLNLDLKASLIVLSACETARGKVSSGEGMIGFTWAFFVAGIPSTIVSQWKVDAISTAELMYDFHLNWKGSSSNTITKAEALRRAALKLLAKDTYSHPYSWAGFILIGDPQ